MSGDYSRTLKENQIKRLGRSWGNQPGQVVRQGSLGRGRPIGRDDDDDVGGNHLCKGRLASRSIGETKKSFSSGRSDDVE